MTRPRSSWFGCRRFAYLAPLALFTGCYYFSAQEQLNQADQGMEELTRAGAEKAAPYEYHLARQYLDRAKIENRESDFPSARDFAIKSLQHTQRGLEAVPSAAPTGAATDAGGWPSESAAPAAAEPAPSPGDEPPVAEEAPEDAREAAPEAAPAPSDADTMPPDLVIVPEDAAEPADLEAEPVIP